MTNEPIRVYHIATEHDWGEAQSLGEYRPASLAPEREGFIHFSTARQLLPVANSLFRGANRVVVLIVDPARLGDALRFEENTAPDGSTDRYPHLYSPLPLDAVLDARPLVPTADGTFEFPREG